ncbi:hypothetical protein H2202_004581 [Exophiala xenobiotica]|nr:hypothetical protein H2202_004581 [Exophiala xenobiotica]KAK5233573.1 hypothetical protein LTR47_005195 [Exophiala xenobiotica]KAK5379562.1 hypothetical protein LTS03_004441 [Exophiala xenobiotica]
MTAQLLPAVITGPFSRIFSTEPGISGGSDSSYPGPSVASSGALSPFFIHQDRQISSASIPSVASAPVPTNDENRDPLLLSDNPSTASRSFSARLASEAPKLCPSGIGVAVPRNAFSSRDRSLNPSQKSSAGPIRPQPLAESVNEKKRRAGLPKRTKQKTPAHSGSGVSSPTSLPFTPVKGSTTTDTISSEETETWLGSLDPLGPSSQGHQSSSLQHRSGNAPASMAPRPACHRKRLSVASSAFVHTMKTASVSNSSFTNVPRSFRFGRSTDSYGIFGSHTRLSTDSDRPATSASVDEAAFRRGTKRRQILAELMATEESYIADLKALIYLYSTLLASAMTISNRTRSSILRNVHDLLHTHERLLESLHQAAYEAAVRKWADTTSPRDLGSPRRHRRWRSAESNALFKLGRGHRHTNSSVDSSEIGRGRTYLGCAEPKDVSDMAAVFSEFLSDFFLYEEYCANHSLIAHELQRHGPTLWSTYESGIESLSRSLVALKSKQHQERKGLTVGDLLIKPIQRVTKYPLLFDDLLRQTPVADCPTAHSQVEETLKCLRRVVQSVNQATDNQETRAQVQRRWSVQSRLTYGTISMSPEHFRLLGNIQLCGVLHVTWQTKSRIDGCYALCILFENSLMVALPAGASPSFEVIAVLHESDLTVGSSSDGRGLQCHSALHTWKICFGVSGHLHEFVFSACSSAEEQAWKNGMQSKESLTRRTEERLVELPSCVGLELRSIGMIYGQQINTLTRHPSVQRAATVGNRANVCQVIIRNTHNAQDLHEFRQPTHAAINRSQSHMTSNRIVVLSPKRSERVRLEASLSDIWTKDRLPYPGMIGSRGGQIIRASAGSLVRKLSLASIHAPFSRRSGSLSMASRKSYEAFSEAGRSSSKQSAPIFEVRKDSFDESTAARKKSHDVPELDTMDNVVTRMIGSGTRRISFAHGDNSLSSKMSKTKRPIQESVAEVGPEDAAEVFYSENKEPPEKHEIVEEGLAGRRKRWSNPLGILKGLSAEGFRNILHSTK